MKEVKILSINGGSSSIKFSLYEIVGSLKPVFSGEIENIGSIKAVFNYTYSIPNKKNSIPVLDSDYDVAIDSLMEWLEKQDDFISVTAIGHRIVHGMNHTHAEIITPELLHELKEISAYDPEHLPGEIRLIEAFSMRFPQMTQIACFDTSFHMSMSRIAQLLSIPRRFNAMGLRRYGFHGLSYAYLMEELDRIAGSEAAQSKIILAHLGNGASIAAVKDGISMDTSMGFTPASGLVMGTRTGDLDPGVAWYFMKIEKFNADQLNQLINHESGLLGVSETSSDMRELLKSQNADTRAADAVELFCYQTKKWIGAYAAVLGGLDILIFSGGIGENAPEIRSRICQGLQFLGIDLDESKNEKNEIHISTATGKVAIHVIKTNEEIMIARLVCQIMNYTIEQ